MTVLEVLAALIVIHVIYGVVGTWFDNNLGK